MKMRIFFMKTFQSGWLFKLNVPRDVKSLCLVANVGEKALK